MMTSDDLRPVGEDVMYLAETEGVEAAQAAVAYARERRRAIARQRLAQLRRICEVYGLDVGAEGDVTARVLRLVAGHLHEQVWREAIESVRPDRPDSLDRDDEVLFMRDRWAVGRMTLRRAHALDRANAYLEGTGMVAMEESTYPNPYQDLWVVDPVAVAPPGEARDGSFVVIVPAVAEPYSVRVDSGRPTELLGMIGPHDEP